MLRYEIVNREWNGQVQKEHTLESKNGWFSASIGGPLFGWTITAGRFVVLLQKKGSK